MKQSTMLLAGICCLESLLGCSETKIPQYSGNYQLIETAAYSNPSFVGEKSLPWDLTIIHRMNYNAAAWDDRLRLEFSPKNSEKEIGGAVVFDFENLTRYSESSFPQEHFKGELIHSEHKQYGGTFCNYQYQYYAFAIVSPMENQLQKVYPERGQYLYTEPSGMPIYETFDPDQFEPDEEMIDEWYEAIENNDDKIKLELFISRNILDDVSGCDSESYLPYDNRSKASLKAVYYSTELHDKEDPRFGFDQLLDDSIQPIDLFKEVISEVKDL